MTTIADIAKRSNCSPTTVSFVLNDHPLSRNIAAKTRERVLKAVEELDYVPNAYAKMLRTGKQRTIGVITFDMSDPYCTTVLHGIELYLTERDFSHRLTDVRNDLERLERFFQEARSRSIVGIIGIVNSLRIDSAKLANHIGKRMRFVSIGRTIPNLEVSSVLMDNREGIGLGIRHLHQLGHRRIAFLVGPRQIEDAQIRADAIREACQQVGIECPEELIEEVTDLPATAESGGRAIRRILERNVDFTAVFAYDDLTAYGVIWELARSGYSIPADISVVGFDDIWPSQSYNPPLTTIRQPMLEMGKESARLVVEALARNELEEVAVGEPCAIVLKPELIARETTAPPGRGSTSRSMKGKFDEH